MRKQKTLQGCFLFFSIFFIGFFGCSTPKPTIEIDSQAISKDQKYIQKLDEKMNSRFGTWNDLKSKELLNSVVSRLKTKIKPTLVLLESEKFILLPGLARKIFISKGAVASFKFENELAFALATTISLLDSQSVEKKLKEYESQNVGSSLVTLPTTAGSKKPDLLDFDVLDAGGLYDFGEDAVFDADSAAVFVLYNANYDPRGATSFAKFFIEKLSDSRLSEIGKILPDPEARLKNLRDQIAKLLPLRDPIVKSAAFDALKKQIRVKKSKKSR